MHRFLALAGSLLLIALSLSAAAASEPRGWRDGPWMRAASHEIVGGDGAKVDQTLHRGSADLRKADARRVAERKRAAEH